MPKTVSSHSDLWLSKHSNKQTNGDGTAVLIYDCCCHRKLMQVFPYHIFTDVAVNFPSTKFNTISDYKINFDKTTHTFLKSNKQDFSP